MPKKASRMMRTLREGMGGKDVLRLQQRLAEIGFPPGAPDGAFGPATTAALTAFQLSRGLLPDGVMGPRTAEALDLDLADAPAVAMPEIGIPVVARMFPAAPLGSIKRYLPPVLSELERRGLTTIPVVLASLATIRAETEGFEPIDEGRSRFNTSPNGHPFDLYDNRRDLGNQGPPDGERYKGRGFVQLTGRANYTTYGRSIGLGEELVAKPEGANDPTVAAQILAAFIASKEMALKRALLEDDLRAARRLVNGGGHGLDRFTEAYRIGERLLATPS